jgi:multimeric flavodoxin WrbA
MQGGGKMKITIINGSPRKNGNGSGFIQKIIELLKADSDIDVQLINLFEKDIRMCKGCQLCYEKGEDFCPIKDDVADITKTLLDCDGMIIYTPTYVVNMSGIMKNFVDRLSYICHRPAFYKKTVLIFTTTGGGGGVSALKTLKWPAIAWGLRIIRCFDIKMSKYNHDEEYQKTMKNNIRKYVNEFITQTREKQALNPKLIELASFNIRRHNYLTSPNVYEYDVEYWGGKGWMDKDTSYFFPHEIGSFKKINSKILAYIVKHMLLNI